MKQKILYIRVRIFLPSKLKILIYAYKEKKSLVRTSSTMAPDRRAIGPGPPPILFSLEALPEENAITYESSFDFMRGVLEHDVCARAELIKRPAVNATQVCFGNA